MSNNPTCTVNGSSTLNGVNVTAGATVTIALVDTGGVSQWNITCLYTDELNSAATVNGTLSVNLVTKTATFTAPGGLGSSLIFQSQINNGRDVNGVVQAGYTTTFKVAVLTATGLRVAAFNETLEDNASFGWVGMFNNAARNYTGSTASAGAGLTFSTGAYNVVAADSTIQINAHSIQLNPSFYATAATASTLVERDGSSNITVAGVTCSGVTLSGNISLAASDAFSLSQVTQASDIATNTLNISAQAPFASATGTHRNPGFISLNLAAPSNSGTVRGQVVVTDNSSTIVAMFADASGNGTLQLAGSGVLQGTSTLTLSSGNITLNVPSGNLALTCANIGFHGATPVAQATRAGQITDSTGGTPGTTFSAITAGAGYTQADMTAVKNALASIAAQYNKLDTIIHNLGLST